MVWWPRISGSGILILAVYLSINVYLFQTSNFYRERVGGVEKGQDTQGIIESLYFTLNVWTCITSLLNVLSHLGVALGALNDTLVLSILAGVGFDVATRFLQLVWWMHLHLPYPHLSMYLHLHQVHEKFNVSMNAQWTELTDIRTIFLMGILSWMHYYHMTIHVRALSVFIGTYPHPSSMSKSELDSKVSMSMYETVQEVLTSALNNLRGIPGEKYRDHLFGYTDLGGHMLACMLSFSILREYEQGLYILYVAAGKMLLLLFCVVYLARLTIPFHDEVEAKAGAQAQHSKGTLQTSGPEECGNVSMPTLCINSTGMIHCGCVACRRYEARVRKKCRKGKGTVAVAFTFNAKDGICRLWFESFETLQSALTNAKGDKLR